MSKDETEMRKITLDIMFRNKTKVMELKYNNFYCLNSFLKNSG